MTFGAEIRCTTNHSISGYSKGVILLSRDVFFSFMVRIPAYHRMFGRSKETSHIHGDIVAIDLESPREWVYRPTITMVPSKVETVRNHKDNAAKFIRCLQICMYIIDGMDQAKTMMPHFYYVCKFVCIYNRWDEPSNMPHFYFVYKYVCIYDNRWDGPGKNNAASFLLCLQICMHL